jgi:hypothetical protein
MAMDIPVQVIDARDPEKPDYRIENLKAKDFTELLAKYKLQHDRGFSSPFYYTKDDGRPGTVFDDDSFNVYALRLPPRPTLHPNPPPAVPGRWARAWSWWTGSVWPFFTGNWVALLNRILCAGIIAGLVFTKVSTWWMKAISVGVLAVMWLLRLVLLIGVYYTGREEPFEGFNENMVSGLENHVGVISALALIVRDLFFQDAAVPCDGILVCYCNKTK